LARALDLTVTRLVAARRRLLTHISSTAR
jgi:hypothetical protein